MKGTSRLKVNHETMKIIVQRWLESELKTPCTIADVAQVDDDGNKYSSVDNRHFEFTIVAKEEVPNG